VKSAPANSNEKNVNTWTLLFAALAFAAASGLAVLARRAAALHRRVAELSTALEGANEQLEMFTNAISEELQAPLRELHRAGRHVMQAERVEMTALAQEVVDELLPRYPRSRVTVVEMPAVKGDRALLRLAWRNLIDNALKFSASAQAPRIEVGGNRHDRDAEYWVRDNGAGFDMANRHRLFEVFQRLHQADEFAGAGTGLAMVRLVASRHGGSVRAQAKPGAGATFTMILPNAMNGVH
jgi:light-regulated signal transduction histidine kinase (bacteriophytochrome)